MVLNLPPELVLLILNKCSIAFLRLVCRRVSKTWRDTTDFLVPKMIVEGFKVTLSVAGYNARNQWDATAKIEFKCKEVLSDGMIVMHPYGNSIPCVTYRFLCIETLYHNLWEDINFRHDYEDSNRSFSKSPDNIYATRDSWIAWFQDCDENCDYKHDDHGRIAALHVPLIDLITWTGVRSVRTDSAVFLTASQLDDNTT